MESKFDTYFARIGTGVTILSGIVTPQLTSKLQIILWSSVGLIFLLWLSNYLGRRYIKSKLQKRILKQPFNEVLLDFFRNLKNDSKDAEIIRWGLALSKPLWLSQNFELRKEIGEYVETSAIKRDNKNALLKVLVDEIGWTNIEMLDYPNGEAKLKQAINLAIELNDFPLLAKAYRHLNASSIRQNQISRAESYLEKSLEATNNLLPSKIKDELFAEYYFAKATIEFKKGSLDVAFTDIEESKRLYESLKDKEWPLKIWARKGEILLAQGKTEEAKNIFIKGTHIAKEQHYLRQQVKNEIGLALCFSKDGHNINAIEHLTEAKLIAESLGMFYELDTINKESIKIRNRH
jgi:tetratricopeptide (TPR) repeat protein